MFGRSSRRNLDRALARMEKRGDGPVDPGARRGRQETRAMGGTVLRTSAVVTGLLLLGVVILDVLDVPVSGGGRYWTAAGRPVEMELSWISFGICVGLGAMSGMMHAAIKADLRRKSGAND